MEELRCVSSGRHVVRKSVSIELERMHAWRAVLT